MAVAVVRYNYYIRLPNESYKWIHESITWLHDNVNEYWYYSNTNDALFFKFEEDKVKFILKWM